MSVCRRRQDCRLCGSRSLDCVLTLEPTPPANAFLASNEKKKTQEVFPLELNLCGDCGHAQLGHVVDPSLLFSDYVYVSGTSPSFVSHFKSYADEVWTRADAAIGNLVVDIGSNDGTLLRAFKNLGAEIQGIDPAQKIAAEAVAAGIPTINDFFTTETARNIVAGRGKAKIVTANNVCAHIDDLASVVSNRSRGARPKGYFRF